MAIIMIILYKHMQFVKVLGYQRKLRFNILFWAVSIYFLRKSLFSIGIHINK